MANFYLDVSAIGNEYQSYADIPNTWGVPQDGNGLAGPGHSASVAIATISCDGASASGTGAVSVFGVTVSSSLNGTGSTLATNIANAINASTTAVSASYCSATLGLKYLVYARVNPVLNTEVQIMLRIAGAVWNGIAPAHTNITGLSVVAFTGGADGPFAYWWNTSTVFGKTLATNATTTTYGLLTQFSPGVLDPTANDVVFVRTSRGGVNLNAGYITSSSSWYQTAKSRTYVFDDGEVWAGDDGQFIVESYSSSGSGVCLLATGLPIAKFIAKKKWGLCIRHYGASGAVPGRVLNVAETNSSAGPKSVWVNVLFEETSFSEIHFPAAGNQSHRVMAGCAFNFRGDRRLGGSNSNSAIFSFRYYDCDFNYVAAMPTPSNLFTFGSNATSSKDSIIELVQCRFNLVSGGPITTMLVGSGLLYSGFKLYMIDCLGIKPTILPGSSDNELLGKNFVFSGCRDSSSGVSARSTFIDNGHAQVSWVSDGTFPYLNSVTPTGEGFSIRALIKGYRGENYIRTELARLSMLCRTSLEYSSISVEFLLPSGVLFNKSQLGFEVTFVNLSGTVVHATSLDSLAYVSAGTPVPLQDSDAVWTGQGALVAKKATIDISALGEQIMQGTEINARVVHLGLPPANLDHTLYIHPELVLA